MVLVLGTLVMGGAEAQLASVLEADPRELDRIHLTILTLTTYQEPAIVERLEALRVPVVTIDRESMRFPAYLLALVRFFRRECPDLVHTFLTGSTGTWGRVSARLAGVPRVMHSDLSLTPVYTVTRTQRLLTPLVNVLTDRFLPNATAIAERLERQGVPRRKIVLVRNGVDVERFDPGRARSLRPAWGVPDDAVVAGFLGMLRRVKRPDLLLDAVQALPPERRPDYVVLAGDGELMPALRRRVEGDPWLRERCRLLGVVADAPSFLRSVDFLVLSSDTEGLPNAVLEAMAMARPCVATRVSDVPFLLDDDRWLVEPGDAEGLATAIARMSALPPEERGAMGSALQARARAEFSIDRAAAAFWRAHHELLPGGGGGS
ncbi:MAG: glycosyltransferase [Deinococcales bacterium]